MCKMVLEKFPAKYATFASMSSSTLALQGYLQEILQMILLSWAPCSVSLALGNILWAQNFANMCGMS